MLHELFVEIYGPHDWLVELHNSMLQLHTSVELTEHHN